MSRHTRSLRNLNELRTSSFGSKDRLEGSAGMSNPQKRTCSAHKKPAPARTQARVARCSVLARQVDYVVGKVQRDLIQRKIGVLDLLGEHDVPVAIVARKRSGSIGTHGELPDLKFLRGDSLVVGLNDSDFIQKPIRSAVLGNVLRAVGVENLAVDPMPIPIFTAGKLPEVAFVESLRRHDVPLSF